MEEWRSIDSYDGYEVSNLGRVRSWWKTQRHRRTRRDSPVVLSGTMNGRYRRFCISVNGRMSYKFAHHVVAEAFHGHRPTGMWVLHRNGDTTDNRADNLYWGTPKQNAEDREAHGNTLFGARNPKAKLSDEQVASIRERYARGGSRQADLAAEYGVTQAHISLVILRKSRVNRDMYMNALGLV